MPSAPRVQLQISAWGGGGGAGGVGEGTVASFRSFGGGELAHGRAVLLSQPPSEHPLNCDTRFHTPHDLECPRASISLPGDQQVQEKEVAVAPPGPEGGCLPPPWHVAHAHPTPRCLVYNQKGQTASTLLEGKDDTASGSPIQDLSGPSEVAGSGSDLLGVLLPHPDNKGERLTTELLKRLNEVQTVCAQHGAHP